MNKSEFRDKISGVLLGTALGDALGFIAEGMSSSAIERSLGKITRFHILGKHGFVTDDTEQTALTAYCLARNADDVLGCRREFKRSLLLWFLCMPFGIGKATIEASLKIALGFKETGPKSAGNGSAMRAAIVGTFFYDQSEARKKFGTELSEVTHRDTRAVEAALFVAELAAACAVKTHAQNLMDCFSLAMNVVKDDSLTNALKEAATLATSSTTQEATPAIALVKKPYAFIINSLPYSTYCFLRYGNGDPLECLSQTVAGGGDTDTNAAIVGAWLGALHGEVGLPRELISHIDDGPFGPTHLRKLADALVDSKFDGTRKAPGYFLLHSFLRNVCVVPLIFVHAFVRLVPMRIYPPD